jgi:hypothetical protein
MVSSFMAYPLPSRRSLGSLADEGAGRCEGGVVRRAGRDALKQGDGGGLCVLAGEAGLNEAFDELRLLRGDVERPERPAVVEVVLRPPVQA